MRFMKLITIRHSNREQINSSETAHLAQLTKEGMNNAIIFGKKFKEKFNVKIDNIFTSNIERCVDTGTLIKDAHALDIFSGDIELNVPDNHDNLASLGYVKFTKRIEWLNYIGEKFKSNDLDYGTIFKELFEKNISIHKDPKDYAEHFISEFHYRFHNTLVVTHDTNIGPIMYHLSEKYGFHLDSYMVKPKPLCGFCLSIEEGRKIIEWINFEDGDIKLKRLI